MSEARAIADGVQMPMLGFGVFRIEPGTETERAVATALEVGYRHIDTAQAYGNEASVGRALADAGLAHDEVFVTSKYLPESGDPAEGAERSLERLGIERLDLYLVHWPQGGPTRAWPGMERALEGGLTRTIGVSNFDVDELDAVITAGEVPPAVNQISLSPFRHRRALLAACELHRVAPEAYGSLTQNQRIDDPTLAAVAERVGRTPAQVLLRWAVQRRIPVIPKSVRRERMVENSRIFDFVLPDEEMAVLDALDTTGGTGRAVGRKWWTLRRRAISRAGRLLAPLRGR